MTGLNIWERIMRFKLFHRHTWSTPHHADMPGESTDRYVMRCYECGAEREVQAPLAASTEIERRIEEARSALQKINKAS
jgi:hypothetical protein